MLIALSEYPRRQTKPVHRLLAQHEVIALGAHPDVFPPGADAIHTQHGWVFIQAARGNRRQVIWYVDVVDESSGEDMLQAQVEWVWLAELHSVAQIQMPTHWVHFHRRGILKVADRDRFAFSVLPDRHADKFGIRCLTPD
ncbi:hypothetical protein [Uliginosibacterium gangwonense]|uniref:hypothetical protein n=1 Tax=Uliginosibacterium gangwonense TaxID=392736 RepID=UPI000374B3AE|nr:hypothetical protein [Uliginosibacterium gangwonense]